MLDLPILYLIAKLAAVAASYMVGFAKTDIVFTVISVLSFACIFMLELLFERTLKKKALIFITITVSTIACFSLGIDILFPLFVILVLHFCELVFSENMYYQISLVAVALLFILYPPKIEIIILTVILLLMVVVARILIIKLKDYIDKNEILQENIMNLETKIKDLKSLMKTLKTAASLEERNRIAARIHDEIGHGISGSIILLEAAMLQMKDNHTKATTSVEKAIENLRESVDEIRTALREERTDRALLGFHDITMLLEEFKVKYNISTKLKTLGDLSNISMDQWICIHDNLKECLTNVLKHSNATEFVLDIQVFKKIIKVVYKDNGSSGKCFEKHQGIEKHLGLEAIEERTANVKGRSFFAKDENGFCVTNIFYY